MFFVDEFALELLELSNSSDQTERMQAAYLIGELSEIPQELLNILYKLLQDEFLEVQTTANEALKKVLRRQFDIDDNLDGVSS